MCLRLVIFATRCREFLPRRPRRWLEQKRVAYEELMLPVTCLTTPGCRLAHFGAASNLGKHVRFLPEWPCDHALSSRRQCWHELLHPVKDRRCMLSRESEAALQTCTEAFKRHPLRIRLPHEYGG